MFVPVFLVRQRLAQHVVKVGVVREDDVTTDIKKETLLRGVRRRETARFSVCVNKRP